MEIVRKRKTKKPRTKEQQNFITGKKNACAFSKYKKGSVNVKRPQEICIKSYRTDSCNCKHIVVGGWFP